jgi:hypothetical protein
MAQQTAVEIFWNQLPKILTFTVDTKTELKLIKAFDEAKELNRQQIESAWKKGDGEHDKVADKLAKQYYTETYGK